MLAELAYVPIIDVPRVFNLLKADASNQLVPVLNYFQEYYVLGHPVRRRRRGAVPPWFPPAVWNQHKAAINNTAKTNNSSEGWHNRFHLLLEKNHPDLYIALNEFQKEQGDTEVAVSELSMGRRVKAGPKRQWLELQKRTAGITRWYQEYIDEEDEMEFLCTVSYNVTF